ncbi:MAG: sel1 repeat family protein [Alphaproteobacteria bacterium]|nr:sel1 repeat family protein [Alphaproteobacteria bacterium]
MLSSHNLLRGLIGLLVVAALGLGGLLWFDMDETEQLVERAQKGDADAQYALAIAFDTGKGFEEDDAKAIVWYRRAAEQGHMHAQHNLGISYENGEGVEQSIVEAVKWYQLAAAQGNQSSQYNLGLLFSLGHAPIQRSDRQALQWFTMAAEQGHAKAQSNLGAMHALGLGTEKNLVQAYKWFTLAVNSYPPGEDREQEMKNLTRASEEMAPVQVELAKKLAEEWKPKPWKQ